ncbi:hypothetical protein DIE14_01425 [Burkholderia sp. Bp9017]|nr:hypothetical protein DIE14_01425 [Burkholderia sp. Bp9017]RQZ37736.1 hypothetical protein DIE13_01415 [Burkholderia sp. Bp9016]
MNHRKRLQAGLIIGVAIAITGSTFVRPIPNGAPAATNLSAAAVGPANSGARDRASAADAPGALVTSFQVRHVAFAGFASALTLGVWPRAFANDVRVVGDYRDGWTPDQFELLRAKAYPAFQRFRYFWGCVVSILIVSAFRRRLGQSVRSSRKG